MFTDIILNEETCKNFRNYKTIFDIIKNNTNIPILSINGKNPFEYITNFGGILKKFKNPQATFRYKFVSHNGESFQEFPLTIEELTNFTLIYENGDTIITDYIIYSVVNLSETEYIKENKFFIFAQKNETNNNLKLKNFFSFNDINSFIPKKENNIFFKNNLKNNNDKLGKIE